MARMILLALISVGAFLPELDGRHRLLTAYLRGQPTILAEVYNVCHKSEYLPLPRELVCYLIGQCQDKPTS